MRRLRERFACCLLVVVAGACAGGSGTPAAETVQTGTSARSVAAQLPDDVRTKLSEELGRMPVHEVVDEAAGIRLSVEAPEAPKIEPLEGNESIHTFTVEIPEAIIECYLYGDLIDPASTMENFFALAAGETADWYGVDEVGASATEGRPYLYGTAITKKGSGDATVWGNLHVGVGQAQYESLACAASGPGRRVTFRRIFKTMLETLESPATRTPEGLAYHSVARCVSPGSGAAIYSNIYVYDEGERETLAEVYDSTVLRDEDLHLTGSDQYGLARSQDGWIVGAKYTNATRDTLAYDLNLTARDDAHGRYEVTGTRMGEAFSATIETSRGIPDVRRQAHTTRAFVRTKSAKSATILTYKPGVDPAGLVALTITRKTDTDLGVEAAVTLGGTPSFNATFDRTGELTHFTVQTAGTTMICDQIWREGEL